MYQCDGDRKSTRLNSSHLVISYAVFCLKKKKKKTNTDTETQNNKRHTATSAEISPLVLSSLVRVPCSCLFYFLFFCFCFFFFFFNDTATTEIYTLSLHDALPILERIYVDGPRLDEHLLTAI